MSNINKLKQIIWEFTDPIHTKLNIQRNQLLQNTISLKTDFFMSNSLSFNFDSSLIFLIFQFDVTESGNFESSLCEQYVHQKLESGLKRLWHDAQTRVSALFMSAELTHFKFDEFLQLLAIVHRYLFCAQFIILTIDLACHISNYIIRLWNASHVCWLLRMIIISPGQW